MTTLMKNAIRFLIALPFVVLLSSCDVDLDDDDDDEVYYQEVTAEFTLKVRDADTGFELPGAEVRFYADHGDSDDLDLYDTYVKDYTDDDGVAYTKIKAVLANYEECIGIRAVVEYSDWPKESTGVVKFWYPDGGSYSATIYVDDNGVSSISSNDANVRNVPSSEYKTIQAAIDAAETGDYVLVEPGAYKENLDFHGKLVGVTSQAGPGQTVIQAADDSLPVVSFVNGEDQYSSLTGFTITGGQVGIAVHNAGPTLKNNLVESAPLANHELLAEDLAAENERLRSAVATPPTESGPSIAAIHIGRSPQTMAFPLSPSSSAQSAPIRNYLAAALGLLLLVAAFTIWRFLHYRRRQRQSC